jgi:hypothetical protein
MTCSVSLRIASSFSTGVLNWVAGVATIMVIHACAVQVPPSGGEKDNAPPVVEKMHPRNKSTNFDSKGIVIRFNEFIQLGNPNEQILISPPLDQKPDFELSGKVLTISHLGLLRKNTTYTINFGNSLTDSHESNPASNFTYVFSTGPTIDTGYVTGVVTNAFTANLEKSISIGLYENEGWYDSIVFKTMPVYYTRTRDDGSFRVDNVSPRSFRIVAFDDENKNLKYDRLERIGFSNVPLNPKDSSANTVSLRIFSPEAYEANRLIDTFCKEKGKFCFLIYRPEQTVITPERNVTHFQRINRGVNNIDSVFVYSNGLINDSLVKFRMMVQSASSTMDVRQRKKLKFSPFVINIKAPELMDSLVIECNQPCLLNDTSRITLMEDSTEIRARFAYTTEPDKVVLFYRWKEKAKYIVNLQDSALVDIYAQYSQKNVLSFISKSLKDYSNLKLTFVLPKKDEKYIIQLIKDNNIVVKELSLSANASISFESLKPGSYRVKIIDDKNGNGKWDNGDYFNHILPEKVFFYPSSISLKAYWDVEQTIDIRDIISTSKN